jgi:hypothetical protein
VREIRPPGSVRGAARKGGPYRNGKQPLCPLTLEPIDTSTDSTKELSCNGTKGVIPYSWGVN